MKYLCCIFWLCLCTVLYGQGLGPAQESLRVFRSQVFYAPFDSEWSLTEPDQWELELDLLYQKRLTWGTRLHLGQLRLDLGERTFPRYPWHWNLGLEMYQLFNLSPSANPRWQTDLSLGGQWLRRMILTESCTDPLGCLMVARPLSRFTLLSRAGIRYFPAKTNFLIRLGVSLRTNPFQADQRFQYGLESSVAYGFGPSRRGEDGLAVLTGAGLVFLQQDGLVSEVGYLSWVLFPLSKGGKAWYPSLTLGSQRRSDQAALLLAPGINAGRKNWRFHSALELLLPQSPELWLRVGGMAFFGRSHWGWQLSAARLLGRASANSRDLAQVQTGLVYRWQHKEPKQKESRGQWWGGAETWWSQNPYEAAQGVSVRWERPLTWREGFALIPAIEGSLLLRTSAERGDAFGRILPQFTLTQGWPMGNQLGAELGIGAGLTPDLFGHWQGIFGLRYQAQDSPSQLRFALGWSPPAWLARDPSAPRWGSTPLRILLQWKWVRN
ncbi:MAG: hypothetical protein AAF804_00355 [Bacteroidota bacterium]